MFTRSRAARVAATVVIAGSLLVGTSGCVFITPTATLNYYDPSDGVGSTLGDIRVLNMLGIAGEDGTINLMTSIHNDGNSTKINIQFESDGEKTTVTHIVGAGETVNFGTTPDAKDVIFVKNSGVLPGELLSVYVQHGDVEGKLLTVPVVDPIGDYEDLAPVAEVSSTD